MKLNKRLVWIGVPIVALLVVGVIGSTLEERENERLAAQQELQLEKLRNEQPFEYLKLIFDNGNYEFYLQEMKSLVPEWYEENKIYVHDQIELAENKRKGEICLEKKFDAIIMSELFVKDGLLAPSTATFPSTDDAVVKVGRCDFSVTSTVDAENRFGVQIRHRYNVRMDYEPDTDVWTRTHLEIVERQ